MRAQAPNWTTALLIFTCSPYDVFYVDNLFNTFSRKKKSLNSNFIATGFFFRYFNFWQIPLKENNFRGNLANYLLY